MIRDENAERSLLAAYCQGLTEELSPDLFTGSRCIVAGVLGGRGRPDSSATLSLWMTEEGIAFDCDLFTCSPGDPEQIGQGLAVLAARRRLEKAAGELAAIARTGAEDLATLSATKIDWAMEPLKIGGRVSRYEQALEKARQLIVGESGPTGWT